MRQSKPRKLGLASAFQQRQDLEQLEALAAAPDISTGTTEAAPTIEAREAGRSSVASAIEVPAAEGTALAAPTDAVDKLSAWLLEHADPAGPT